MVIKGIKQWIKARKMLWAARIINEAGLTIVKIVEKAGTRYIINSQGEMLKIGGKIK